MFQIRFVKLNIEMEALQDGWLPKDKASGIRAGCFPAGQDQKTPGGAGRRKTWEKVKYGGKKAIIRGEERVAQR